MECLNSNKVYVDVLASFSSDGALKPLKMKWENGHIYEITRITEIRNAASYIAGGAGVRYTCIIDGRSSFLFFEKGRWFVERK